VAGQAVSTRGRAGVSTLRSSPACLDGHHAAGPVPPAPRRVLHGAPAQPVGAKYAPVADGRHL